MLKLKKNIYWKRVGDTLKHRLEYTYMYVIHQIYNKFYLSLLNDFSLSGHAPSASKIYSPYKIRLYLIIVNSKNEHKNKMDEKFKKREE